MQTPVLASLPTRPDQSANSKAALRGGKPLSHACHKISTHYHQRHDSLRKPDSRKGICALPLPWPLISEPEILVIDEVLAVGDAEFQKKCLGKIDEVSRLEGRMVLLVSHNMAAIAEMADRALLLDAGSVAVDGRSTAAPVLNSR